ncbi:Cation/H(+) antiporter 15 [Cucurbita argyrosperma subsp. argyrosperma]|nr:Cation/H(+) antiporter 15 [Cucurbita argyrosperma subsp. argyrosperma]
MGSIVMEPGDNSIFNNFSSICVHVDRIHSNSVFIGENPLEFSVPLLLLQLGICSGTIIFLFQLLKRLAQPLIVSQILSGLVLGYFGAGFLEKFRETIFPIRGLIFLDAISALGQVFYFFLIGVQTDMSIIKNIDKRAFGIGVCSVILPTILSNLYTVTLVNTVDLDTIKTLFVVGNAECFIHFAMVASLLNELHLINSKFGKIALASSMSSNCFGLFFQKIGMLLANERKVRLHALSTVYGFIVLAVIILSFQPVILWMTKNSPVGQPLKESFVITLFLGVLVVAFCSQASGMHVYFGPILLGITIPPGPPIGSAMVEKLDIIASWVLMPIFFAKIGLIFSIHTIKLLNFLCISFIIIVAAFGKFLGALMMSIYYKLPTRDGVALGLILNSQGALEIGIFKLMKEDKVLDEETFVVMCICVMLVAAFITPILRYLFDPSRRFVTEKKRTVMHLRPEFDLSVLVCIHDQDDVPSAINILEALKPTHRSHLIVYMLHLVVLLGRANPQLIHHRITKLRTSSRSYVSESIVNAFNYFGQSNSDVVTIHPITAVSPSTTMYEDVCSLALDKRTSLILIPFHKRFHSNGMMSLSKYKMKMLNQHILDKAPCSVALIVERGIVKISRSISTNLYSFQIAIVFIGGPDDREAIFIGTRMIGHPYINVTLIRLLEDTNSPSDGGKEMKLNNEAVSKYHRLMENNHRVRYLEEVAKDCTGTVAILRTLDNNFDLILVGKRHSPRSPLVQGLLLWNEQTELGSIGEVLASSDFIGNATIFVVQQHRKVVNEDPETSKR